MLGEAAEPVASHAVVAPVTAAPVEQVLPEPVSEPVSPPAVPPEPGQPEPDGHAPLVAVPDVAVSGEPAFAEATPLEAVRFPIVPEEEVLEPVAAPWAREDTREFEPISVPELAEDTIEPLHRLRLDKPAQGEPRREARPTRASRDFDWGE